MTQESLRNIEIKAQLKDEVDFLEKCVIAFKLTGKEAEIIKQHDVFFNVTNGRLKLRYLQKTKSVLVQYDRPDTEGPKLSKYNLLETDEPELLERMLAASIGIKGVVDKTRNLFLHKQTRIHLDNVKGLGYFMEFEVLLQPEETIEFGNQIAKEMMEIFKLNEGQLLKGAYMDQILNK